MSKILDGKKLSDSRAEELTKKISLFSTKPQLLIIQIGDLEESNIYIKRKKAFAEKIGAVVLHKKYSASVLENDIVSDISAFNSDPSIHGIIVQLPMPKHFNKDLILESIIPTKDVDGLTSQSVKALLGNTAGFMPATTKGILTLLDHYEINLWGKRVVVVGRSTLVGKPTAIALLNKDATVTICHIHTKDLKGETKRADIVVVAAGSQNLITKEFISPGQIIIDVGINVFEDDDENQTESTTEIKKTVKTRKIVGDVDFENIKDIVAAITPVPGGVGPMTIVSLFENLLEAYSLHSAKIKE